MGKNQKVDVRGITITYTRINDDDFICIMAIAKYKNLKTPSDIIKNWLRSKNTIENLGKWEKGNNPGFNYPEFGVIGQEAGTNRFIMSLGQWIARTEAKESIKSNIAWVI